MDKCPTLPFEESEPPEQWRPVVGFPNYIVSDRGRVCSLRRPNVPVARILKPRIGGHYGHLNVHLTRDGESVRKAVHRLVTDAFLGPQLPGQQTRHGPGGRFDNSLANLSRGSAADNAADMIRDGNSLHGSRHPKTSLFEADIAEARRRYEAGEHSRALAAFYGLSLSAMRQALKGETWRRMDCATSDRRDFLRGTEIAGVKLNEQNVREIRRRYAQGVSQGRLAKEYGMTQPSISAVVNGKTWKHVA